MALPLDERRDASALREVAVNDGWVVLMAGVAAFGAWRAAAVPLVVALAGCAIAWWRRPPWVLCLSIGLRTSALAARALAVPLLPPRPGVRRGDVGF